MSRLKDKVAIVTGAASGIGAETAAATSVDVGDPASVEALMEFAVERFGGLDILDNHAADTRLSSARDVGIEHRDIDVWDSQMRTNLRGTMLACKYAIPKLRARGGDSTINTSSGAGLTGALVPTAQNYAAVVFLASDAATFITGQTICVDGGLLSHAPYYADVVAASRVGDPK